MVAGIGPARIAVSIGVLLFSTFAWAGEEFLGVRNYSPFAQIYGLPGFADASLLGSRQTSLALTTTIINHSDLGAIPGETVALDGETYITELALGYGVSDRLSVIVEVPWVAYSGGIFDGAIEGWHDFWGLPNAFRDGPNDQLLISYARNGLDEFVLDSRGSGIGDVRLRADYRLVGSPNDNLGVVLRAGLKLPTGDAENLRGSEATDYFLDLAARKAIALPRGDLVLLAHVGVLLLGDGEVLPQLQRDTVGFAGAGMLWRVNARWRFNLQLNGQSSYFDTDLKPLGSDSLALTMGGSYTWVERKMRLSVAVVEDPLNDTIPDVALQIKLSKDFQ